MTFSTKSTDLTLLQLKRLEAVILKMDPIPAHEIEEVGPGGFNLETFNLTAGQYNEILEAERGLSCKAPLQKFYVSLVKDLIGVYLEFDADSEEGVREYLAKNYMTLGNSWKLPWCAVYSEIPEAEKGKVTIVKAKCGPVFYEDYAPRRAGV